MKIKTTIKTEKSFVKQMRDIRDKINLEIKDLSFAELKEYFNNQKYLSSQGIWQKNDN